jgi:hypothetical protein
MTKIRVANIEANKKRQQKGKKGNVEEKAVFLSYSCQRKLGNNWEWRTLGRGSTHTVMTSSDRADGHNLVKEKKIHSYVGVHEKQNI